MLAYSGRPESALEAIRTAVRLDPRPSAHLSTYYGLVLFLNHRYEDAIAVLEPIAETRDRGIADSPREILAMSYARLGRRADAREQVRALHRREPFLNLAYYRMFYSHHARAEDLEHRLDALRGAGMPQPGRSGSRRRRPSG